MAAKPKIIYILHLAPSEIFVLYVFCVCSVILSLYPHQTDTEHTTVMPVQVQPTELHSEVSWRTNMLKVHLVTALDNIPKVVGSSPTVVMHILCFSGVKIHSE